MTKQKQKLDAATQTGMAMLAPARAAAERMGVHAYAAALCKKLGHECKEHRVNQIRAWLQTDPAKWKHPRAGVVKLMLEIK